MEIRISKIVRIRLANKIMARLKEFQIKIWNPKDPRLVILWFSIAILITDILIIIMEEFGFVTNLINLM